MSKILERLVLARLRPHLHGSVNFSQYQSAYRAGHSTETALLDVVDGVYTATDDKQISESLAAIQPKLYRFRVYLPHPSHQ